MKVLISFLFIFRILSFSYSPDLKFLPNPFLALGENEIFHQNSLKWIEKFALNSMKKMHYQKALHAWCFLLKRNHPLANQNIISLLDKLNKPTLKIIFLVHYDDLNNLDLDYESKENVYDLLDYLVIREKLFRGMTISDQEFQSNKYTLSEYFYQRGELENQKLYLQNEHLDPYQILDYHRLRSKALSSQFKLQNSVTKSINDYFLPHVETFNQLNYGLESQNNDNILMDAEHLGFLIRTSDYTPPAHLVNKYPILVLDLLTLSKFTFTSDYWDAFLKLLNNPFWLPKINLVINDNLNLRNSLGLSLSYIFPKVFSFPTNPTSQTLTRRESEIKFIYSNHLPDMLLNRAIDASKTLQSKLGIILPVRWANLSVPFVFDPIDCKLIVSTQSIFWSKDVWRTVLMRNRLYLRLLKYNLTTGSSTELLPPLWLIDSIANSKTSWNPSIHGLNYKQVQYLSLYPLSLKSLYKSSRNRARKNLFYAYHWQCTKIGELLFGSMKLSEILNKIQQLQVSSDNPRMLYHRLSIYFNTPINQLHKLIPQ